LNVKEIFSHSVFIFLPIPKSCHSWIDFKIALYKYVVHCDSLLHTGIRSPAERSRSHVCQKSWYDCELSSFVHLKWLYFMLIKNLWQKSVSLLIHFNSCTCTSFIYNINICFYMLSYFLPLNAITFFAFNACSVMTSLPVILLYCALMKAYSRNICNK
jgi:hypothetical protein